MVIMWEVFKAHPNCSKYRNGGMILVIQALVLFLGGFHGSNLVGSAFGAESFGGIVPITALGANCDGRHECVLENRFVPISLNSTPIHLKWKVLAILEEMMYDYVLYYFNGGDAENRTPVRTHLSQNVYVLSLCFVTPQASPKRQDLNEEECSAVLPRHIQAFKGLLLSFLFVLAGMGRNRFPGASIRPRERRDEQGRRRCCRCQLGLWSIFHGAIDQLRHAVLVPTSPSKPVIPEDSTVLNRIPPRRFPRIRRL